MCSLSFGREAAVLFQICHILNPCVGSPTLQGGLKKKRENSWLGCLSESAVRDTQLQWRLSASRVGPWPLVCALMLCACHCTRSHHPGLQHGVTACCCMPCLGSGLREVEGPLGLKHMLWVPQHTLSLVSIQVIPSSLRWRGAQLFCFWWVTVHFTSEEEKGESEI